MEDQTQAQDTPKAKTKRKKRGRKANRKTTAVAAAKSTPKKRGRKPGRKPGRPAGKKRGRKAGRPAVKGIQGKVNFEIAGSVLIMNNIPTGVDKMVFVKQSKMTTVEI
jgi:hypothetical protein